MKRFLTNLEAYSTMYCFLKNYYHQTTSDDVGTLLGSLQFTVSGEEADTADPASWYDWVESIHLAFPDIDTTQKAQLSYLQAFKAMYRFLSDYQSQTSSEDAAEILEELEAVAFDKENRPHDEAIWQRWTACIPKALLAKSSTDLN